MRSNVPLLRVVEDDYFVRKARAKEMGLYFFGAYGITVWLYLDRGHEGPNAMFAYPPWWPEHAFIYGPEAFAIQSHTNLTQAYRPENVP